MRNSLFQFICIGGLITSATGFEKEEISARWKSLDELAKKAVSSEKIPGGSVCVVENGSVVFNQSYGVLHVKTTKSWESNTPVFIASITKPITATLVAILVEEKKLSFDDPISKYIPEYLKLKLRDGSRVRSPTIAECLSHTSGFTGGNMSDLPRDSPILNADQAGVAKLIAKRGLAAKPGKRFAYTFRGYAAVARCVEVATGRRFYEVLNEKLLMPLGMAETSFLPDLDVLKRHPRYAQRIAGSSKEEVKAAISKFRTKLDRFVSSSGGLVSTSNDLVKFFRLHSLRGQVNDKQLISPNVISRLYQKPPGSRGYGLGFKIFSNEMVGHGGASGTSGVVDLKYDRVVVILTQAGSKNARPLTGGGRRLALDILSK
ncbi:MAG: serine hydrolase domain-containing protein [Verrucomicrobiota bacterium]|jgi:CubicO group peptidase (beta-lactamase class C family)|nr:serine hydrolase domain-containing protein [Verrucomicrobiota bacterium]